MNEFPLDDGHVEDVAHADALPGPGQVLGGQRVQILQLPLQGRTGIFVANAGQSDGSSDDLGTRQDDDRGHRAGAAAGQEARDLGAPFGGRALEVVGHPQAGGNGKSGRARPRHHDFQVVVLRDDAHAQAKAEVSVQRGRYYQGHVSSMGRTAGPERASRMR